MLFKVNSRIFEQYPGFVAGIVVVHDIDNKGSNKAIQDLLKHEITKIKEQIRVSDLDNHPHILPWRAAYKNFGANPKNYLSSIENLIRRIIKAQAVGNINKLVDLYNVISLKYLLPAGGEDLNTIVGDIELTFASEHEKAITLLGDAEPRQPKVGEVMYRDDNGAICRRWNWREADRTKLTVDTKDAFLILEALPSVPRSLLEAATHELAHLVEQYCGGSATVATIDAQHPEVIIKKNGIYVPLQPKKEIAVSVPLTVQERHVKEEVVEVKESEEHRIRVEKVKKLREQGIEPWPQTKPVNATCQQVVDEFAEHAESKEYQLIGRIVTLREHGKTAFVHIQDRTGKLQLYMRKDVLGDAAFDELLHLIDVGDIIWCSGQSFRTKMGEITLKVTSYTLMSKCLHPLPEKFHGIADIEIKYRQRYLDLIATPESRERFKKRSQIITKMRHFFEDHNFLEVETPMLHPIAGGAAAHPFVTHHNALDMDLYLRIAPELYLKRLVIGGLERVYEVNRNFRNEGISTRHNPEFTSVEWYVAYEDYVWMMDFTEQMIHAIARVVCADASKVPYGDLVLDFASPFKRMTMLDAVMHYAQCSESDLQEGAIDVLLKKHKIALVNKDATWGHKLYALFEEFVEPQLMQPTFITQFPVEVSPLAKRNPHNPALTDRFELFLAGMELANGFTELNDPFDQEARFKEQVDAKAAGDSEAHEYDADFILALEYGLPPTVGAGIGIDRLVMVLTNTTSIKDVILFPTLKKK